MLLLDVEQGTQCAKGMTVKYWLNSRSMTETEDLVGYTHSAVFNTFQDWTGTRERERSSVKPH